MIDADAARGPQRALRLVVITTLLLERFVRLGAGTPQSPRSCDWTMTPSTEVGRTGLVELLFAQALDWLEPPDMMPTPPPVPEVLQLYEFSTGRSDLLIITSSDLHEWCGIWGIFW